MTAPAFVQTARRNYLVPVLLALLLLSAAGVALLRSTPNRTADLSIPHLDVWHSRTVYKNETIQVARDTSQDDLYVLPTLHIDDQLRLPLFVKDLTATLVTAEGETFTTSAMEKADLAQLLLAYPELRKRASGALYRDTEVPPGRSAEGMVLLHFPISESTWKHRRSATLTVDFYHQPPQTLELPKP